MPAEQHRPRAEAVDDEARGELHDAARAVERRRRCKPSSVHDDVELGAQQRKQRRQRQLEKVRDAVREADDADDARIAPQRTGPAKR